MKIQITPKLACLKTTFLKLALPVLWVHWGHLDDPSIPWVIPGLQFCQGSARLACPRWFNHTTADWASWAGLGWKHRQGHLLAILWPSSPGLSLSLGLVQQDSYAQRAKMEAAPVPSLFHILPVKMSLKLSLDIGGGEVVANAWCKKQLVLNAWRIVSSQFLRATNSLYSEHRNSHCFGSDVFPVSLRCKTSSYHGYHICLKS